MTLGDMKKGIEGTRWHEFDCVAVGSMIVPRGDVPRIIRPLLFS
jgi:hypothetical protein